MSSSDVKEAVALAFLAGLGLAVVGAPVVLDSMSAGYDDGLLAGFWSSGLLGLLSLSLREALDGVEDDGDDGVGDRTPEERL